MNVIRKENFQEKYKKDFRSEQWEEYILDEEVFAQLYQAIASIASSMNTTEDTIKAYKRRAKQVLKQRLGNLSIYTKDINISNIKSLSVVVYFIVSLS